MIVKNIEHKKSDSLKVIAGDLHEKNVAFYLRRAFKDDPYVLIFNDYKFSHNNENAQIDHLILYKQGFILIESKSIKGNVKVNAQGEWSRSYKGNWQGIPSPINQVLLQQQLLRDLLFANRENILNKILGMQQSFGGRCWDVFCAISSDAIIERGSAPKDISSKMVKSEFLVESILAVMKRNNKFSVPRFSEAELNSITDFLISQCSHTNSSHNATKTVIEDTRPIARPGENTVSSNQEQLLCKKCSTNTSLEAHYGKYGYYLKCTECQSNTALKSICKNCSSKKTKIKKRKNTFISTCSDCNSETTFILNN